MPYEFAFANHYECSVYSRHVSEKEVLKEHIGISIGTLTLAVKECVIRLNYFTRRGVLEEGYGYSGELSDIVDPVIRMEHTWKTV